MDEQYCTLWPRKSADVLSLGVNVFGLDIGRRTLPKQLRPREVWQPG
jgi:hypothetical protein